MSRTRTLLLVPLVCLLAFGLAGCGAAKPAALSNAEVLSLSAEVLTALNENDYAAFTADFSTEMLSAFPEEEFTSLREMLQASSGDFLSTGEVGLTNNKGYAIYRIICTYALEDVAVTIVFKIDGVQVEGLFFDSPNLRSAVE